MRRSGGLSKRGGGGWGRGVKRKGGYLKDLIRCEGLTALGVSDQGLSSLESSWLAVLGLSLKQKALRSERVASCVSAPSNPVRTMASRWRLCHGEPRRSSHLGPIWGFRADPELGTEPPATSDGGDIGGLT